MGALCSSAKKSGSSDAKDSGDIMSKVKNYAFTLIASSAGGAENDSEFSFLKDLVLKQFTGAEVKHEVDPSKIEGAFDVSLDKNVIHSKEINGKVEENQNSIIENIKKIVMEKVKTLVIS